jgi:glycosyltransferase involved in cell wall biosynthesis
MGDTNGPQLLAGRRKALLFLKRVVLSRLVDGAFALGETNALANALLGISHSMELPLYAIDYSALDRGAERPYPHAARLRRPAVACISRLVPRKNLQMLATAWGRWVREGGEGSLVFVGDGPERERVCNEVRDLPAERIAFWGAVPRSEMGGVFAAVDAVVLPSTDEPWGIVIPEALGMGRPVLATDRVGAALSLASRAGDAMLLTSPDVAALRGGLASFLGSHAARAAAAQVGRDAIRESFDMNAVAKKIDTWARRLGTSGDLWSEAVTPSGESAIR